MQETLFLNKIQKYYLKLLFPVYIGSASFFILLFLLGGLRTIMDSMFSSSDISFWIILKLMLLTIPRHIMISAPVALVLANALVFGTMSSNNEIMAVKSFGVHLEIFIKPLLIFSILVSLFTYFDIDVLDPAFKKVYNDQLNKYRIKSIESALQPGKMTRYDEKMIYVEDVKIQGDGKLFYGIKLFDNNKKSKRIIYAKIAYIEELKNTEMGDLVALVLKNGYLIDTSIQKQGTDTKSDIDFERMTIFFTKTEFNIGLGIMERSISDLYLSMRSIRLFNDNKINELKTLYPGVSEKEIRKDPMKYGLKSARTIEKTLYFKIGLILSTFAFGFAGFSIVKGVKNLNVGLGLFISVVIIMFFYGIFILFTQIFISKTNLPVPLVYFSTLGILFFLSFVLYLRGRKF